MKDKSVFSSILSIFLKISVALGVILVFYKVPSILADNISYMKLKKRDFNQNLVDEDK